MPVKTFLTLPCCSNIDNADVGPGTAYPAGVGLAKMMQIYWKFRTLTCHGSAQIGDGVNVEDPPPCCCLACEGLCPKYHSLLMSFPSRPAGSMKALLCDVSGSWYAEKDYGECGYHAIFIDVCNYIKQGTTYYPFITIDGSITSNNEPIPPIYSASGGSGSGSSSIPPPSSGSGSGSSGGSPSPDPCAGVPLEERGCCGQSYSSIFPSGDPNYALIGSASVLDISVPLARPHIATGDFCNTPITVNINVFSNTGYS